METIFSGFSGNPGEGLSYRHLTTNYSMYGSFHRHESYEFYLFLQGKSLSIISDVGGRQRRTEDYSVISIFIVSSSSAV